ncbi:glycosyltransferase [Amphiplicatus metriothermophilus]|uniref:Glycosyltransferase like family 2 n=1 Tax=Amphiplicatus metriothermophilus TaxID=1519374 RepID=A0A239Q0M0_9PROT|nr:glycosyltransferase [Amphiplicatus metriothermophilus]MBB5520084.1 glycosyltransferase involved in cell wall biosynthesis [Amphiplicatus metriothermophilus]SNT75888.1 Glycosyltransferase like family 2 [Amphiplicatus metriothermophilus]
MAERACMGRARAGDRLSFSIAVPVGGYHPFLPRNLASLSAQHAALQVSLLDASGDPRVRDVADRYGALLAYRRHGPDAGQSAAIIEGWANTPGEILGWLNADDILMPGALARAEAAFRRDPSLDMVYGHSVILDDAGRMIGYHWAVEPQEERILETNVISQPSCFFRREAYERAGGLDRDLHYTMDWDLWVRLFKSGAKIGFINAPLSMVLWGRETKTASFNTRRRAELARLIDAHASGGRRRRTFRGFAVQAFLDRLNPGFPKDSLLHFLHRRSPSIYGVRADGWIESKARLYLAHYDDTPKRGVEIVFARAARGARLECDKIVARVDADGRALKAIFEQPIEAGQTVVLDIALPQGGARLRACAWI